VVQKFGALDSMRTMMNVLREVSLDDIREQAETAPRLLIVAPTAESARRLGLALTGPEGQFSSIFRAIGLQRLGGPCRHFARQRRSR
jgi:hypothetical protein